MQYISFQNVFGFTINKKLLFSLLLTLFLSLLLSDVFAEDTANDPLGNTLCRILNVLMGSTAKAIATIAVIFVAIGLFAGRMTWLTVIPIIIGIIIIFSAPAMVAFIGGTDASKDCATGVS